MVYPAVKAFIQKNHVPITPQQAKKRAAKAVVKPATQRRAVASSK
jgi:hypothetical protein